jgi:hypothetical protein
VYSKIGKASNILASFMWADCKNVSFTSWFSKMGMHCAEM